MTKEELKLIKALVASITKRKEKISAERDFLREEVDNLDGLLQSLDEADEMIMEGLRELQDGLDRMSEYI